MRGIGVEGGVDVDGYPCTDERVEGESMDGSARAVVDGDGRLVDLTFRWDLLRRPAWQVTEAVVSAVNAAQDAGRVRRAKGGEIPPAVLAWFETINAEAAMAMDRATAELHASIAAVTRMLESRRHGIDL